MNPFAKIHALNVVFLLVLAACGGGGGGSSSNGNSCSGSCTNTQTLRVTAQTPESISLSWSTTSGASYYLIQKTSAQDGMLGGAATTWQGTSGTSMILTDLLPGRYYEYSLLACAQQVAIPSDGTQTPPSGCSTISYPLAPYSNKTTVYGSSNWGVSVPTGVAAFDQAASKTLAARFGLTQVGTQWSYGYNGDSTAYPFTVKIVSVDDANQIYGVQRTTDTYTTGRITVDSRLGIYGAGIDSDQLSQFFPNLKTMRMGTVNPILFYGSTLPKARQIGEDSTCTRLADGTTGTCSLYVWIEEKKVASSDTFVDICPASPLAASVTLEPFRIEEVVTRAPKDPSTYTYPGSASVTYTHWFANGYGYVASKASTDSSGGIMCLTGHS